MPAQFENFDEERRAASGFQKTELHHRKEYWRQMLISCFTLRHNQPAVEAG
jgi:hypothetical protein